jgi:hypothetical protein
LSTNITHINTLRSTLRISKRKAAKARKLYLPELNPLDGLEFGDDGFAPIPRFWWCGESSGNRYHDVEWDAFIALTEGEADLILFWEGGDFVTGARIRDGVVSECEVRMELAEESEKGS